MQQGKKGTDAFIDALLSASLKCALTAALRSPPCSWYQGKITYELQIQKVNSTRDNQGPTASKKPESSSYENSANAICFRRCKNQEYSEVGHQKFSDHVSKST